MTIEWINPAALAGLAAVAGPVLVHLLRRQRATHGSRSQPSGSWRRLTSAAARLRNPSDLLLLSLRIAIVAAAAIAAAQPMLMTGWRRAAWEQRINRALVVDDSESLTPRHRAYGMRLLPSVGDRRLPRRFTRPTSVTD